MSLWLAYPGLLEKGFASSLAAGVAGLSEALHVDKGRRGKEDGVVEEQAHLTIEAIAAVDDAEERVQVDERHKRVDKLDVGLEQGILKRNLGQRESALHLEIAHILGGNLAGQRPEERRELWRRGGLGRSLHMELLERAGHAHAAAGDRGARIIKEAVGVDRVAPSEARGVDGTLVQQVWAEPGALI